MKFKKKQAALLKYFKSQSTARIITLQFILTAVYFLFAKLGLLMATLNHSVSPVWPATGFAFSVVYLFGRRAWFPVAIGAFLANSQTGAPFASTVAIALGNTLEAISGALIIHWIQSYRKNLTYQTETFAISIASGLSSLVSSSIGVGSLYFLDVLPKEMVGPVWLTWWVGDTLGGLVVAPILIQFRKFTLKMDSGLNGVGVLIGILAITYFVFFVPAGGSYIFLLFPLLLYSVKELGNFSVLLTSAFLCVVSILATVMEVGPFAVGSMNERLIHLQFFLAAIALSGLTLSGFGKARLTKIPALVLMVCWTLSGLIYYSFDQSEKNRTLFHFTTLVGDFQEKLLNIMDSYEEVLRGGSGLFAASKSIEFEEWKAYNETLNIADHHRGLNGLGVVWPILTKDIPRLNAEMRKQGMHDFSVRALSGASFSLESPDFFHYVVKFIEPFELNKKAIGLDLGSEPNRRKAAEISRNSGLMAMTSKITLTQDKKKLPGFLFLLPIYKKNVVLITEADRQKAHLAWIYGAVIYQKFFSEVLGPAGNEIDLEVFDGDLDQSENRVYSSLSESSNSAQESLITKIKMGQRNFTLKWTKSPHFVSSHNTIVAWVGLCGALSSLLLVNLMITLQLVGQRSRELAEELTKELSKSREKFQEGERRLLYALEGSNDGIWDWNIEKAEMYVSGKMAETNGWPQFFYAQTDEDLRAFAHPDDIKKIGISIGKVLRGKCDVHEVETRYRTTKGEWRWVLTRGKISERKADGTPIRMTGVHIDIHDLKKAQNALEETQYQLRNIANSVPSLVSLWSKDLKCEFANDAFAKWFGSEADKLIGVSIKELLSAEAFEYTKKYFVEALKGKYLQYERESIRALDGAKRFVVATYLPNKTKGSNHGFFLFIQDITDLKQAELAAIEERKTALDATNIKSQFLANMSHEIRTPLNGIIGMTNLLKKTELDSRQREYSEIIGRSSDSLLNIINDVLDFSKVEAGKLELEIVDFSLRHLVSETVRTLSFSANEKGLSINTVLDLKSEEYFQGDPGRLRQILNNLVGNAIKFTSHGTVAVKVVATEGLNSSLLKFEVTDTGIGISEQAMGRMFQAFSQADATMTRRFGGTGLGLSICKQLIQLMGGEIGVTSNSGQGSTFWFQLNLPHGRMVNENEGRSSKLKPTLGARILIVEDNRVNQQIALELLQSLGYSPHAVGNGYEALETLRDTEYDLVLMDCQMPEMDGFEATSAIRKSQRLDMKSIPIIAMTASALTGDKEKCLSAGMNDYVSKPIDENQLVEAIEKWLKKNDEHKVGHQGHILVVEDNNVNQNVICLNLENLSYTYDIASNGLEALECLSQNTYDLILMDCQMPEMDGYEATKKIREMDSQKFLKLPIIALTANAMKGDREKCLAVGMNDYLTKPIDLEVLSAAFEKWLKPTEFKRGEIMENENRSSVIDMATIQSLRKLQKPDRPDLLTKLIGLFSESAEQGLAQIRVAVKNKDMKALSDAAHSLKSSAANLGALAFSNLCLELEKIGDGVSKSEKMEEIAAHLEIEYDKALKELQGFKIGA